MPKQRAEDRAEAERGREQPPRGAAAQAQGGDQWFERRERREREQRPAARERELGEVTAVAEQERVGQ